MLSPMYWVKRKIQQIKRVIDFFPLIWNGFDFDYRYSIDLFKHQLKRTADYLESDKSYSVSAKNEAKKIRTAIKLMDKVYDGGYLDDVHLEIDKLYGTTHYDFEETGELDSSGEPLYRMTHWNEGAVDDKHQKEIDEIRNEMLINGREKEKRAHKLLWNFIEHNIQRWWD